LLVSWSTNGCSKWVSVCLPATANRTGANTSGLGQVFWYTVERSDETLKGAPGDMDLRTLQDWTIRLILRTAPGVDDVTSWGGQERPYEVRVDPMKLIARKLDFKQVIEALQANNAQVGGNFIDMGRERYLIRGPGRIRNTKDLGNFVLKTEDGTAVHARDVASLVEVGAPRTGTVTGDGKEVVLGMALTRIGENAKSLVGAVINRLELVKPVYERTDLVNASVGTAVRALIEGSILMALVLLLGELRSALVVVTARPWRASIRGGNRRCPTPCPRRL
jgi:cobalt-zinc-cadmium resistance protein CzcA